MRHIKARMKPEASMAIGDQRSHVRCALGVCLEVDKFLRFVEDPLVEGLPVYDEKDGYHVRPSVIDSMIAHKWIEYKWLSGEPKATPKPAPRAGRKRGDK
jgi:hypothetical protein